ncbi:MAG: site-specific DNA-methyltransferase [Anaerolinea sp.]|nr:site-specific DNA-methyltransferase [Anaerolinea sp.]
MPVEKLRPSFTFDRDRLEQLKAVVPEAFADGKINWETLREALGEHLEDEGSDAEHFGLTWPGKRAARRRASEPSRGTLVPVPGEGVDEETTRNIFIEADNLEALKLMLKAYAGRVKMIYIDPPYNTGNDFIYRDDYRETQEEYLRRTEQMSASGQFLTTNTKADGRFHSNWLSMMYPRLVLGRSLLNDQGAIFVSIDNGEIGYLRATMNEMYGEENFIDCIVWQKRVSPANDAHFFSSDHEYILIYAKNKTTWQMNRLDRTEEQTSYYTNPDNDPRGPWNSATYATNKTKEERPNLYYPITNPNTGEVVYPKTTWKYSPETHKKLADDKRIYWGLDGKSSTPRLKLFLSEASKVVPRSVLLYSVVGHTQEATSEYYTLFPEGGFTYPKPVRLIKHMLTLGTEFDVEDIVLDFFAGSGTTAQAVMQLNAEDGGNRQFILAQLPETIEHANYSAISEITKERLRRAGTKIKEERKAQLPIDTDLDLGFKAYRFAPSAFKQWQDYEGEEIQALEQQLTGFETPLVDDWKEADLLTEVMLLQGFPLDSRIETMENFATNTICRVSSDFHAHRLYICLDPKIAEETIAALALGTEDIFVCLDSALTDESKMHLADVCNLRVI